MSDPAEKVAELAEKIVESCTHTKIADCSVCIFCLKDALHQREREGELKVWKEVLRVLDLHQLADTAEIAIEFRRKAQEVSHEEV